MLNLSSKLRNTKDIILSSSHFKDPAELHQWTYKLGTSGIITDFHGKLTHELV